MCAHVCDCVCLFPQGLWVYFHDVQRCTQGSEGQWWRRREANTLSVTQIIEKWKTGMRLTFVILARSPPICFAALCSHSQIRRWLPRPLVWGNRASRKCGASQCCGVSVCLQRGAGLWGSGDARLWHEGNEFVSEGPRPTRTNIKER